MKTVFVLISLVSAAAAFAADLCTGNLCGERGAYYQRGYIRGFGDDTCVRYSLKAATSVQMLGLSEPSTSARPAVACTVPARTGLIQARAYYRMEQMEFEALKPADYSYVKGGKRVSVRLEPGAKIYVNSYVDISCLVSFQPDSEVFDGTCPEVINDREPGTFKGPTDLPKYTQWIELDCTGAGQSRSAWFDMEKLDLERENCDL